MMDYNEAWAFLDNLQFFKIKLGLDSMSRFLDKVGNPQENLRFIHIAGTNGKGSVAATLLTILTKGGYKTGLYTSPHLSSVRERFRINDTYISREEFAEHASSIRKILNGQQITYFEFTTALALLWFAASKVDAVILEVGLGGRLDATNVITPLVSVITNVSMDHEAYLGDTLELIASEKAGIIKEKVPVVSGAIDEIPEAVIKRKCLEKNAPLYLLDRDFSLDEEMNYHGIDRSLPSLEGISLSLRGRHQKTNTALALAAQEILASKGFPVSGKIVREALPEVRWPGRLEYFCLPAYPAAGGPTAEKLQIPCPETRREKGDAVHRFLLDGAHNPAGAISLKESLRSDFSYRNLILVWACMSDKDVARTLAEIAPMADSIIFTMPESERSATAAQLTKLLPDQLKNRALSASSVDEALQKARKIATEEDLILVAGSLYLIGAAREILLGGIVT